MLPKAGKLPVNPVIFINKSLLDWKPAVRGAGICHRGLNL